MWLGAYIGSLHCSLRELKPESRKIFYDSLVETGNYTISCCLQNCTWYSKIILLVQSTLRITTFGRASEKCPYSRSVVIPGSLIVQSTLRITTFGRASEKCRYTRKSHYNICIQVNGLCSGHGNSVVIRELSLYPQPLLAKLTVCLILVHHAVSVQ